MWSKVQRQFNEEWRVCQQMVLEQLDNHMQKYGPQPKALSIYKK